MFGAEKHYLLKYVFTVMRADVYSWYRQHVAIVGLSACALLVFEVCINACVYS